MSPGPGSGHSHGENLILRPISLILLGYAQPLSAPQASPTPLMLAMSAVHSSPAQLEGHHSNSHTKDHVRMGYILCCLQTPEQPRSRQAGLSVSASTQNAKSRRPKGVEKGFSRQGSESTWRGRGQAKPGLMLWGGEGNDEYCGAKSIHSLSASA